MADFSSIVYNGEAYMVKDETARERIAALEGGSYFIGVTTTEITDQSTTNPIVIGGEDVTATNGNIAIYGQKEFIFDGTKWIEFGDLSTLGALAYKDRASGTYTPAGSVDLSGSQKSTTTVNSITAVGSLPSLTYDSDDESLTFNRGSLPTKGEDISVLSDVTLSGSFSGTQATITVS